MRSRKQVLKNLEQFYIDVQNNRKNKNMRLQVNNEFQQFKIKDKNDRYNVTRFTTSLRGGKAFSAEQKIRELKSRISKLKAISDKTKAKASAVTIIKQSGENVNDVKSEKYVISHNDVEKNPCLARNLRQFKKFKRNLILKGQSNQKRYQIDLTRSIKENILPRQNNYVKIQMQVKKSLFQLKESRQNQHLGNFTSKLFKVSLILTKNSVYNKK